jgi:hygromycin-B 7''-O-kinase
VLVVHERGGWRISELLDFENVVAGDPLLDLARRTATPGVAARPMLAALAAGYGDLRDGWRDAVDLYVLCHLLELWDWFAATGHTAPLASIAEEMRVLTPG